MNPKSALAFEKRWIEEAKNQYQPDAEKANAAIVHLITRMEEIVRDNVRLMTEVAELEHYKGLVQTVERDLPTYFKAVKNKY